MKKRLVMVNIHKECYFFLFPHRLISNFRHMFKMSGNDSNIVSSVVEDEPTVSGITASCSVSPDAPEKLNSKAEKQIKKVVVVAVVVAVAGAAVQNRELMSRCVCT